MSDFKILHIKNKEFSLINLEGVLMKELPGKYQIYWYTKTNRWELQLKWDGTNYTDLYPNH